MSYQYYLNNIAQLMAMGFYNPPVYYGIVPSMPLMIPMLNQPDDTNVKSIDHNAKKQSDELDDTDERSLFCANLDQNVTEELLYELFLQAGPIQKVYIPKDINGKQRSYGFVTYKYCSTPFYALQLYQGVALFGKRLDIKLQGKAGSEKNYSA